MFNEIKKIIENVDYKNVLNEISFKTNIDIEDYINTQILNIGQKKIDASELRADELLNLLFSKKEGVASYSAGVLTKFKKSNLEEEYPKGEEIDEDDEDDDEEETLSIISLIGFLIEYYYLSKSDITSLDKYFNKIRLPNRKEHINTLREIYSKI
ncbi:hypothetical protein KLA_15710 [Cellulophaga geojensis KL-A]|uniref:Uncharacterized protein n=1 Tax=Cellulophaga geojensis KL-A TaxID=1328323 RepID=A0ABN0RK48_9FLAO|nr:MULTISPECIES: hypothetical protein [Cellulophaga]EWH11457.1 hypothetical protein KLA_15710 [Cellulophaga geojensis KL-A]MDO6855318.1 hypothetical protein [Cellulophaga lytica]